MNVLPTLSALQLWHARMKSVLILVSVQDLQIALLEITEESALASQVTLVTPMELHVHRVSVLFP